MKRFDDMTIEELQRERRMWNNLIDRNQGWGPALDAAIDLRTMCDALITRRLAERREQRDAA